MKELIRVRVQYASRQQCCKTHKWPLPYLIYYINIVVYLTAISICVGLLKLKTKIKMNLIM